MIIARSPLRISLGGGGTDLPSYYLKNEGFLISAAISKYVYVTINRPFLEGIYIKYSEYEFANNVNEIKHPIIREVLKLENLNTPQIEITSLADIPSGTGLGSSGSFTCALIKAIYTYRRKHIDQEKLAELACDIEINKLREPIGKQDQYISALGGVTCFAFHKNDKVSYAPLNISTENLYRLEENLLLFFTGFSRSASKILEDQNKKTEINDSQMIENLNFTKELGYEIKKALETGDIEKFGEIMHIHWEHKKTRSKGMSNEKINTWYDLARKNGAVGGKVVGAGGGGFLMFIAYNKDKLRACMSKCGLEEVHIKFDFEGTKIIHS